jgi:hypothetical protein
MLSSQTFNIGMDDLASYFQYGSQQYPLGLNQTLVSGSAKEIPASFTGFLELAYKRNPVIYACMEARRSLFAQARFKFMRVGNGKEGDLFGTNDLAILENPWPNGMTSDLLSRAIQDADLAGNAYCVTSRPCRIRLRSFVACRGSSR